MKIYKYNRFPGLFFPVMLSVVSSDTLYLYYSGGWYDPNRAVEYTEVALMYLFAVAGITRFTMLVLQRHPESRKLDSSKFGQTPDLKRGNEK